MKKLSLTLLTFIVAGGLLAACSSDTSSVDATSTAVSQPASSLIAEGRLEPANSLEQAFPVGGQVAEVLVQDGDKVSVGQPLARLNASAEAAAALARAEQQALTAQQALDDLEAAAAVTLAQARLEVLARQDALDSAQESLDGDDSEQNQAELEDAQSALDFSQAELDALEDGDGILPAQRAAAEAAVTAAQQALASAQAAQAVLELQSTLDGTVIDLDLQPGMWVSVAQPALTVADLSDWVVKTDNLTEMQVVEVSLGQKVQVVFDALPDREFSAEVTHINARYEEKRGDITYTVTLRLDENDPQLRWGMTAAVYFAQ